MITMKKKKSEVTPTSSSEEDVMEEVHVDLPSSQGKAVMPSQSSFLGSKDVDTLIKSSSRSKKKSPTVTCTSSKNLKVLAKKQSS